MMSLLFMQGFLQADLIAEARKGLSKRCSVCSELLMQNMEKLDAIVSHLLHGLTLYSTSVLLYPPDYIAFYNLSTQRCQETTVLLRLSIVRSFRLLDK